MNVTSSIYAAYFMDSILPRALNGKVLGLIFPLSDALLRVQDS